MRGGKVAVGLGSFGFNGSSKGRLSSMDTSNRLKGLSSQGRDVPSYFPQPLSEVRGLGAYAEGRPDTQDLVFDSLARDD